MCCITFLGGISLAQFHLNYLSLLNMFFGLDGMPPLFLTDYGTPKLEFYWPFPLKSEFASPWD